MLTQLLSKCVDTTNLPTIRYNFVELAKLTELTKDSVCGTLGDVGISINANFAQMLSE